MWKEKRIEEKQRKEEDHRISSIGMSPLKRRVPSHIEGFGNILIGYAERVMQKGRDFHETAATGHGFAATGLSI